MVDFPAVWWYNTSVRKEVTAVAYDNDLVAGKLRRWETYLDHFRLPPWEEIPDLGLYMEQVIDLLRQYLDYLPPELKEEQQFITAAAINNYVRTRIMPQPRKKRYYREHIAYLIMILTLKPTLSMALIQRLIPSDLPTEEVQRVYTAYARCHAMAAVNFLRQARAMGDGILQHDDPSDMAADTVEDLIAMSAITAGFSRLLAEKLLLLQDKAATEKAAEKTE